MAGHLLKCERIRRKVYRTKAEARQNVVGYIEMFYKPTRKHARIGALSTVEFEPQFKRKPRASRTLGGIQEVRRYEQERHDCADGDDSGGPESGGCGNTLNEIGSYIVGVPVHFQISI